MDWVFKSSDIAIMVATLLGPVLAVQAQKWVEGSRERQRRRVAVFRVLMTTRGSILSPSHVEALNIVPIEFYGNRKSYTEVVDCWKEYIEHLYKDPDKWWLEKRIELLNKLLTKMGSALGYKFNSAELTRELYSPKGHGVIETDQEIIRQGLAKLFKGEISLPLDVKSIPMNPTFAANQVELHKLLVDWLTGQRSVKVVMQQPDLASAQGG